MLVIKNFWYIEFFFYLKLTKQLSKKQQRNDLMLKEFADKNFLNSMLCLVFVTKIINKNFRNLLMVQCSYND